MSAPRVVSCEDCGNPCATGATGWYRCRQCGYESLRDPQPYDRYEAAYVAASTLESTRAGKRGEAAPRLGLSLLPISDK
jgi:hypothetical protein